MTAKLPLPRRASIFLALSVLILGGMPSNAKAQTPELTMAKAIEVFNEIALNPKSGPPRQILIKAEGIAIIPDQVSAGFVIGAKFGRGVVLLRRPDGSWSNPVFIHAIGGSFGLQAGAEATDLVLVFKGRKSVESFLNGKGKLTMGIDATAAAGPVGRSFEAGTDLAFKAEILSYSRSRGIFAGVSAAGGTLSVDRKANTQYYGMPIGSIEIFADNAAIKAPPSTAILRRLLASQTGVPVVRKTKPRIAIDPEGEETQTIIEGEDDDGVEVVPKTSSRRSSTPSKRATTKTVDRDARKKPPTDDGVILSAGSAEDLDDDSEPTPTRKAKSTSWKKSKPGSAQSKPISSKSGSSSKNSIDLDEDLSTTTAGSRDE